jgi:hypothetical protein
MRVRVCDLPDLNASLYAVTGQAQYAENACKEDEARGALGISDAKKGDRTAAAGAEGQGQ